MSEEATDRMKKAVYWLPRTRDAARRQKHCAAEAVKDRMTGHDTLSVLCY